MYLSFPTDNVGNAKQYINTLFQSNEIGDIVKNFVIKNQNREYPIIGKIINNVVSPSISEVVYEGRHLFDLTEYNHKSVIYVFTCLVTKDIYIGSAINGKNRVGGHKQEAKNSPFHKF